MTWRNKKVTISDAIPSPPPIPKPLTCKEQLNKQLLDVDAAIKAAQQEREHIVESLMFLKLTPQAEEQMNSIWERLKPKTHV